MINYSVSLDLPSMGCFHGCLANELTALHNRHLVRRLEPVQSVVRYVAKRWRQNLHYQHYRVWTEEEVIRHTSPDKRKRVVQAFVDYHRDGLLSRDVRISSFIKHEKAEDVPWDPLSEKDPRLIQYRSFKYTALFKKHLMPFEANLWRWNQQCELSHQVEDRLFSKEMNSFQIALNLKTAWDATPDPVADLFDVSRMDAHMNGALRELVEFPTYRICTGSNAMDFFLRNVRRNTCRSRGGIRYTMEYTVCSGEANTSSADSIVMAAALKAAYPEGKVRLLVCGDDSVAIVSSTVVPDHSVFVGCGLPTKHERVGVFEEVEFCQCRPVQIRPGVWRMVRNPERVLSRTPYTIKTFQTFQNYMDYLASVGRGELASNDGVPVLQAFAEALMRLGTPNLKQVERSFGHRRENFRGSREITECARASFEIAWGIRRDTQLALERFFATGGLRPLLEHSVRE